MPMTSGMTASLLEQLELRIFWFRIELFTQLAVELHGLRFCFAEVFERRSSSRDLNVPGPPAGRELAQLDVARTFNS